MTTWLAHRQQQDVIHRSRLLMLSAKSCKLLQVYANLAYALIMPVPPKQSAFTICVGEYQQALDCYNKALTLNPSNCDAYVARGAAHANQKHFHAAVADFQAALRLDPSNANAAKYLQATTEHMQATAASEEARHAVQQQHKQHHQRLQQTGHVQQQQSAGHQQYGQDALKGSLSDRHQQQQATTGLPSSHNAQQQQQGHNRGAHKRPRSSSRSRSREARKRYDSGSSSDDSSEPSADPDEQGMVAQISFVTHVLIFAPISFKHQQRLGCVLTDAT